MLDFLLAWVAGISGIILYVLNLLIWPLPVFVTALLRLIPIPAWQQSCTAFMQQMIVYWADVNNFIQRLTTKIEWDVQGMDQLKPDDWYLLIANHQSWADILVLERVFARKIPSLKFFMKKQLLWTLPLGGLGAKLLGFPFMERYSKSFLAKHPELKGKDLETTRIACEKFKNVPTAIISFPEGTRFRPEKHQRQASPYQYLLRPRAGSTAFTLSAMGKYFHKFLDVTIVYPPGKATGWDYFSGRIKKIIVHVNVLPISPMLMGDYENDRKFRIYFQGWLNELWHNKDILIADIIKKNKL